MNTTESYKGIVDSIRHMIDGFEQGESGLELGFCRSCNGWKASDDDGCHAMVEREGKIVRCGEVTESMHLFHDMAKSYVELNGLVGNAVENGRVADEELIQDINNNIQIHEHGFCSPNNDEYRVLQLWLHNEYQGTIFWVVDEKEYTANMVEDNRVTRTIVDYIEATYIPAV